MTGTAQDTVLLTHAVGLHARPSVKLTKLAKGFVCRIEVAVAADGPWVDAKSIVKVMAMKVPRGTLLHVRAEGEGAAEAVAAVKGLVERDFDETHADAGAG
jgi:phosphocarrier protein